MQSNNNQQPNHESRKIIQFDKGLLWTIALMAVISTLSLVIYDSLRHHPVMTVDVEAIMQQKLEQLQRQGNEIKQDQMIQLSRRWAQQLANEVERLSTEYNAVVLVRPAVVQGSIDMTQHVLNKLKGVN